MPKTTDFIDVIQNELARDPELADLVDSESVHADIAQAIYEARKEAGLSQKRLAELVDTSQPVISRMEDASYDGHSISLLRRIARALGCRLCVQFVHENQKRADGPRYGNRVRVPWSAPPAPVDTATRSIEEEQRSRTITIKTSVA